MRIGALATALALAAALPARAPAQTPVEPAPTFADLADLALSAPIAAHVRIARAALLAPREAPSVASGHRRYLVTAEVIALIRGEGGLPARVRYLVDLPNDGRGRPARLTRRSEHLLLAARAPGRPDELRLVARDAQLPHSAEAAALLRALLRDLGRPDAPPRITSVGRAFHVRGNLPGESESQIFLATTDGRPISLSVLRRPGERPSWAVALAEMVDEAAAPASPDTLLWYRLACGLPPALPAASLAEAQPTDVGPLRADYRLVIESLGPCRRNRGRE